MSLHSCDDYDDYSTKHVYGENENPYLRVDADATVTTDTEFEIGRFDAHVIQLEDYAELFKEEMDMTVDQVIKGLSDGSVVFYNINLTKNIWDKAAMTNGSTGWYYNSSGVISEAEAEKLTVTIDIDTNSKTLIINALDEAVAGTVFQLNVGFAVTGPDYDNYVRFAFNLSITDPSIILSSISIPAGDYNNFGIDLEQYSEVIEYNMDMTVDEFVANFDHNSEGNVHMYIIDPVSNEWDETSSYTANAPGYWMNDENQVCSWGDSGFSLYSETNLDEKVLYIGRAPELAAGTSFTISVGYKNTLDEMKFFRFIITITLE